MTSENRTIPPSLVDHLEKAHEHAKNDQALYHLREAIQITYCEEQDIAIES